MKAKLYSFIGIALMGIIHAQEPAPPQDPDLNPTRDLAVNIWGGYNIAVLGPAAQSTVDSANTVAGSSTNRGGLSAGADFWMQFQGFELGGGFAYMTIYEYSYTQTTTIGTTMSMAKLHYSLNYLPIFVQGRRFLTEYFYAGAFVGYYIGLVNSTSTSTVNGVAITTDTSTAGGTLGIGIMLGFEIKLEGNITLDLGVRAAQLIERGIGQSIMPNVGVTFRF
jgi:hypothetical protein